MNIGYLNSISKSRSFLMGLAIIWVYMLHSPKCGISFIDFLASLGWCGVDIFIFLSAIGLCFSLNKNPDTISFYKRRFVRIVPTWLILLFVVHILGIIVVSIKPELPFYHPHSLRQIMCWYTGIGYWISGFVSGQKLDYYYEWYIPTLLLFYVFAPFLYKQRIKTLVIILALSIVMSELLSFYKILYYLHFSYQRIPIYILGFIVCRCTLSKESNSLSYTFFLLFVLSFLLFYIKNEQGINISKSIVALFMLPFPLLIFSYLNKIPYVSLIGSISLELYLIHLYGRPHYLVSFLVKNVLVCNVVTFVLCFFVALILNNIMCKLTNLAMGSYTRK